MFAIEVDAVFDGERYSGDGAVVIVDDGRIAGVEPRGTALSCEVTCFEGGTLLPGLIDTHVHLCCDSGAGALDRIPTFSDAELVTVIENSLNAQLASGVTTVRDLGDRSFAVVDWRSGDNSFPTVVASGPPITIPQGHCWNMGGAVRGTDELRRAVAERAERGADLVKIMASGGANTPGTDPAVVQFSAEEILVVVDESHARGLPVTAHAHSLESIKNSLSAGVDSIEHCSFITADGVDLDESVVADLITSRTTVCPTLGIVPGANPPPAVLEMLRRTGTTYEARINLFAGLHESGVRLVSGSDGGINPGKAHGILPEAVIGLVQGGVSPEAALTTATSTAATTCGLSNKGRILEGFDADLLILPGNPTTDITRLRTPQALYLQGNRVNL